MLAKGIMWDGPDLFTALFSWLGRRGISPGGIYNSFYQRVPYLWEFEWGSSSCVWIMEIKEGR